MSARPTLRTFFISLLGLFLVSGFFTPGSVNVRAASDTSKLGPMAVGPDPSRHFTGYLNSGLTVMMMVAVLVVLVNAGWRCIGVLTGRIPVTVSA